MEVSTDGESGSFIPSINNCSFHDHFRGNTHKLPYTPTSIYFHLLYIHTCASITIFKLLPQDFHKDPPASIRSTSMEAGSRFTSSIIVDGSRFTSMEIIGSFHERIGKFSLTMEVEASIHCFHQLTAASTTIFGGSFHQ